VTHGSRNVLTLLHTTTAATDHENTYLEVGAYDTVEDRIVASATIDRPTQLGTGRISLLALLPISPFRKGSQLSRSSILLFVF